MLALRCLKPPAELCSSRRLMMLACPPAGGKKSERIMVLNDNIQRAERDCEGCHLALHSGTPTRQQMTSQGVHTVVSWTCMQIPLISS